MAINCYKPTQMNANSFLSVAHLHLVASLQPSALRVHGQLCVVHEDFIVPALPRWAFRVQLVPGFAHPLCAKPRQLLKASLHT